MRASGEVCLRVRENFARLLYTAGFRSSRGNIAFITKFCDMKRDGAASSTRSCARSCSSARSRQNGLINGFYGRTSPAEHLRGHVGDRVNETIVELTKCLTFFRK